MKHLRNAIGTGLVLLDLDAESLDSVLHRSMKQLALHGKIPVEHTEQIVKGLLDREAQASTAIGNSVAVPHVYLDLIREPTVIFVRLVHPLNLGAPDGIATQFFFILLGPKGQAAEHLDLLMNIARLMSDDEFRYEAGIAQTSGELLEAIDRFIGRTTPAIEAPTPPAVSEELAYSGRIGGGLWQDIRRRIPFYWRDIRDGLHTKCVGSVLFLLFACLAPAVTFGGFMALETENHIGAVEMLVASALCGMVFAVLSGQPLIILGGTGPLLIFTVILYRLCGDFNIPFLPTYAWVGLWMMVFTLILALTDASSLMRYFTRFTDEIFAALISVIFISEALKAIIHVFAEVYDGHHDNHDKALLTLLLAIGTYYIALNLSGFRRSRYLRPKVREFLADFGPSIALVTMTAVTMIYFHQVALDPLSAPTVLGTSSGRPWQVDVMEVPLWVCFAAALPAMLGTILVFLDQNITARLVNNPEHKLEKGGGYHLDLAVVGGLIGVCSLFGLPWLVAATVRSLNHVRSLATVEEVALPSGEQREKIIHVRETRLTGFAIHLLIGMSLLLLPLLRQIPMAVLYGLFLYMGIVSMRGNQFFERLSLWPMDSALYPATHYIRKVPGKVIHAFTFIQLLCLVVLWIVKTSALGILFPLFIALLAPVRFLLNRFFKKEYLRALDAEEIPEEEEEDWH